MPEILTKKYEKHHSFLLKLVYDSKRHNILCNDKLKISVFCYKKRMLKKEKSRGLWEFK